MNKVFRNRVAITSVRSDKKTQFAFGQIIEENPRTIFFPHWVVRAYGITQEDCGHDFDCLFIDKSGDKGPMAIYIIDQDFDIKYSDVVGEFSGSPGSDDFNVLVRKVNNRSI